MNFSNRKLAQGLGIAAAGLSLALTGCSSSGSDTSSSATPTTPSPTTSATNGSGPACDSGEISAAIKTSTKGDVSVIGFNCEDRYAGASYTNSFADINVILVAKDGSWVVDDSAGKNCQDLPAKVQPYCSAN